MKRTVRVVDDEQNMHAVMRMASERQIMCLRPLIEGEAVSPRTAETKQSTYRQEP